MWSSRSPSSSRMPSMSPSVIASVNSNVSSMVLLRSDSKVCSLSHGHSTRSLSITPNRRSMASSCFSYMPYLYLYDFPFRTANHSFRPERKITQKRGVCGKTTAISVHFPHRTQIPIPAVSTRQPPRTGRKEKRQPQEHFGLLRLPLSPTPQRVRPLWRS